MDSPLAIISLWPAIEVQVLKNIYFECTGCGKCCRENKIPASEQDLWRMEEHGIELDTAIEEFSPILIPSRTLTSTHVKAYVLRQKPFVGGCVFLTEENRCKIHEFKPLACKLYPFSVRPTNDGKIEIYEHPFSVCEYVYHTPPPSKTGNMYDIAYSIAEILREDVLEGQRFRRLNQQAGLS